MPGGGETEKTEAKKEAGPLQVFVLLPDGTKHARDSKNFALLPDGSQLVRDSKRALSLPRQVTVQDALSEISALWGLPKPDADKIEAVELRLAAKRDGPRSFHGRAAATAAQVALTGAACATAKYKAAVAAAETAARKAQQDKIREYKAKIDRRRALGADEMAPAAAVDENRERRMVQVVLKGSDKIKQEVKDKIHKTVQQVLQQRGVDALTGTGTGTGGGGDGDEGRPSWGALDPTTAAILDEHVERIDVRVRKAAAGAGALGAPESSAEESLSPFARAVFDMLESVSGASEGGEAVHAASASVAWDDRDVAVISDTGSGAGAGAHGGQESTIQWGRVTSPSRDSATAGEENSCIILKRGLKGEMGKKLRKHFVRHSRADADADAETRYTWPWLSDQLKKHGFRVSSGQRFDDGGWVVLNEFLVFQHESFQRDRRHDLCNVCCPRSGCTFCQRDAQACVMVMQTAPVLRFMGWFEPSQEGSIDGADEKSRGVVRELREAEEWCKEEENKDRTRVEQEKAEKAEQEKARSKRSRSRRSKRRRKPSPPPVWNRFAAVPIGLKPANLPPAEHEFSATCAHCLLLRSGKSEKAVSNMLAKLRAGGHGDTSSDDEGSGSESTDAEQAWSDSQDSEDSDDSEDSGDEDEKGKKAGVGGDSASEDSVGIPPELAAFGANRYAEKWKHRFAREPVLSTPPVDTPENKAKVKGVGESRPEEIARYRMQSLESLGVEDGDILRVVLTQADQLGAREAESRDRARMARAMLRGERAAKMLWERMTGERRGCRWQHSKGEADPAEVLRTLLSAEAEAEALREARVFLECATLDPTREAPPQNEAELAMAKAKGQRPPFRRQWKALIVDGGSRTLKTFHRHRLTREFERLPEASTLDKATVAAAVAADPQQAADLRKGIEDARALVGRLRSAREWLTAPHALAKSKYGEGGTGALHNSGVGAAGTTTGRQWSSPHRHPIRTAKGKDSVWQKRALEDDEEAQLSYVDGSRTTPFKHLRGSSSGRKGPATAGTATAPSWSKPPQTSWGNHTTPKFGSHGKHSSPDGPDMHQDPTAPLQIEADEWLESDVDAFIEETVRRKRQLAVEAAADRFERMLSALAIATSTAALGNRNDGVGTQGNEQRIKPAPSTSTGKPADAVLESALSGFAQLQASEEKIRNLAQNKAAAEAESGAKPRQNTQRQAQRVDPTLQAYSQIVGAQRKLAVLRENAATSSINPLDRERKERALAKKISDLRKRELRVGDASSTPWAEVAGERLHNAEAVASLERELAELGDADERRHRRHADCQYLLCTEDTDKWPEEAALRRAVLDACMAYHDKHQKQHWLAGTGQESAATLKILEQVREARRALLDAMQEHRDTAASAEAEEAKAEAETRLPTKQGKSQTTHLSFAHEVRRRKVLKKVLFGRNSGPSVDFRPRAHTSQEPPVLLPPPLPVQEDDLEFSGGGPKLGGDEFKRKHLKVSILDAW